MLDFVVREKSPLLIEGDDSVLQAVANNDSGVHVNVTGGGVGGVNTMAFGTACEVLGLSLWQGHSISVGGINQVVQAYEQARQLATCYVTHFCTERFIRPGVKPWFERNKLSLDYYGAVTYKLLSEYCRKKRRLAHNRTRLTTALTNFETGEPTTLQLDLLDLKQVAKCVKATASLPCVGKGYVTIDGVPYTDGGLSQQIGVASALKTNPKYLLILVSTVEGCAPNKVGRYLEEQVMKRAMSGMPTHICERLNNRHERFALELKEVRAQMALPLQSSKRYLPPTCIVWPRQYFSLVEQNKQRVQNRLAEMHNAWWRLLWQLRENNERAA